MSRAKVAPSSAGGPESIRRNTVFALAVRILSALFTSGLTLFLVRYLGPTSYGVFALALSVSGLLAAPADFGVSFSAGRFIAERRSKMTEAAGVLKQALGLKLVGAGLMALVLLAAAGPIARAYGIAELELPLRIMAAAMFAQSFMTLFLASFEALGRNSLAFRLVFSESAIETAASIGLVLAGAGVAGAAVGRVVGYGLGAILGLLLVLRAMGRPGLRRRASSGLSVRTIAQYAGVLFLVNAAFVAFAEIDSLLIGAFLSAQAVGLFSAPLRMLEVTAYPGLALAAGVGPRLARGEGQEPNVAAFQTGLRLVLIVQFALLAPIVVWATPITQLLFGSGYSESADVLRALGPYVVLRGPAPILAIAVNYLGEARRRVPLAIGALAINAALDVILIPTIGIVAGAISTNIASLAFVTGHVMICRGLIDLQLRPLAKTLARAFLASAAMAGALLAFGTSSLTAVEAVAGAVLGLAAYAAVLLATREVDRAQLRDGWRLVRGALPSS
ncbi:MAG: oligosaccharide flippase family protein [Solirubrobacterales bacterium]